MRALPRKSLCRLHASRTMPNVSWSRRTFQPLSTHSSESPVISMGIGFERPSDLSDPISELEKTIMELIDGCDIGAAQTKRVLDFKPIDLESQIEELMGECGVGALGPRKRNLDFKPTAEWQLVPENVICPAGLQVRFDLASNSTFARIHPTVSPTSSVCESKLELPILSSLAE